MMKNQTQLNEVELLQNQLLEEQNNSFFLQSIFNSIQNGISVLGKDFKIIKTNNYTEKKYGDNIPLEGQYCFHAFFNRTSLCKECPVKRVFKTGEQHKQVVSAPIGGNMQGWMEILAFPIKNKRGMVTQVVEVFYDVSEQKTLELKLQEKAKEYEVITQKLKERNEELRLTEQELITNNEELESAYLKIAESKQKFEGLYNYAPLSYQSLDIDGNILEVNPAWLKTLGYAKDEVIGKWFGSFLHPDFVPHFKKNFPIFKKQGYISDVHFKMRKKDGNTIYVSFEGCIGYTPEGKFKQTFCTFKDITKEKLFELSLKKSEEKYRILIDTAPYGIQLSDKEGRILYSNPAHHRIQGYKEGEIVGKYVWDFVSEEKEKLKTKRYYKRLIKEQLKPALFYSKDIRKDGQVIDTQINWEYIRNEVDELEGIISIICDITESRQQQDKLKSALEDARIRQKEITALLGASKAIPSSKTFDSAAKKIFSICKKLIGAKSVYVALLSEDGSDNKVIYLDSGGLPCDVDPKLPMPIRGLREIACKIKDVAYNNDFVNSEWIKLMPEDHVKLDNVLFAPLTIENKVLGFLGIANKPGGFNHRDINMTKAFSELAVIALTYADHQEKLQQSEYRFKKLFENMQSGVAIYEPLDDGNDFKIVAFNKMAKKITRTDSYNIIGSTLLNEFPNIIHTPLYRALKEVYETKKEIYLEPYFYKDNKREGWRENNIYTLPSGEIVNMFTDATERIAEEQMLLKQSEDLLKEKTRAEESEDKFKRLVNNMYDLVCEVNENAVYTFINSRYYDILGYKPEELLGRCSDELIHPEDLKLAQDKYKDVKTKNEDSVNFWRFRDKKGDYKLFECKSSVYIDKQGRKRTVVISQDITERHENELELIKSKEKAEESDRLKTEFLNNMSHEIRTPMNGIIGFSEILDQKELSSEKRSYYTSIIKNSSNQLLRIIDDILEISTLETKQVRPNLEKICLNGLLMELFTIFSIGAKDNNIHLYIKKGLSDSDSFIETDRVKLFKVLSNLLENAIKFTFEGYVELGYVQKDKSLEIYVKDTGIGIDPKNFDVIFKRFSQEDKNLSRKAGGLGLGLSIAKENTELIGGAISLESEKGKGTTFFITIPHKYYNSDNVKDGKNTSEDTSNKKTYNIVVAEDEEINSLYIEEVLNQSNNLSYKVIQTKNGKETLDVCSSDYSIDLVLMDIKMPVMNGYEATREIKKIRPDLPIIAQTAFSTDRDRLEALSNGCNDFISKPINKEKLFELINKHLDT